MNILITGGCWFVGHHIIEHIFKNTDWDITIIDRLSYSGSVDRLRDINVYDESRVRLFTIDFTRPIEENLEKEIGDVDYILHLGAESHVDSSITDPRKFVYANVVGTLEVLEFARRQNNLKKFVYFSTDEVFGPAPEGISYKENDRYNSWNPYSATKAGWEELCVAYANTYKLPVIITHTMNVFWERQHPEKFIPKIINCLLKDEAITIHSNETKTKSWTRFYIHGRNVASAVFFLLENGNIWEKYNIVWEQEVSNLDMALYIAKIMWKELKYEMVDFHSSRPWHDLRYALDWTKMKEMWWEIPVNFYDSLWKTVNWFLSNKKWL